MKKKILSMIVVILSCSFPAYADEFWYSGHHEITDGESYNEIWMYNDSTATMSGGDVFKLETFDVSSFNMHNGDMDILYIHNNSTISIYSGSLIDLGALDNSSINLYAYDVVHYPTGGGHFNGWVEGKYIVNDTYFSFSLIHSDSFSHINIIPEPTTILLLGTGGMFLSGRNRRNRV